MKKKTGVLILYTILSIYALITLIVSGRATAGRTIRSGQDRHCYADMLTCEALIMVLFVKMSTWPSFPIHHNQVRRRTLNPHYIPFS